MEKCKSYYRVRNHRHIRFLFFHNHFEFNFKFYQCLRLFFQNCVSGIYVPTTWKIDARDGKMVRQTFDSRGQTFDSEGESCFSERSEAKHSPEESKSLPEGIKSA